MPVVVSCHCGARFEAKDTLLGKRVKCPSCGGPLAIPAGPSQPGGAPTAQQPASRSSANQPRPAAPSAGQAQPRTTVPKPTQPGTGAPQPATRGTAAPRQSPRFKGAPASASDDVSLLTTADVVADDPLGLGSDALGGDPLGGNLVGGGPLGGDPLGGTDPLAGVDLSAYPTSMAPPGGMLAGAIAAPGGVPFAAQKPAREGLHPAVLCSMIGAGAVVFLMIVGVVVMSIIGSGRNRQVASPGGAARPASSTSSGTTAGNPPNGTGSATGTKGSGTTGPSTTVPPTGGNSKGGTGGGVSDNPFVNPPDRPPTSGTGTGATGTPLPQFRPLPEGLESWYTDPSSTLWGARAAEKDDAVVGHYSWLVELLPHLGHQAIYDMFDFNKSWAHSVNDVPVSAVIPQFLNPTDDRYRWDGYPFDTAGLSHFAGMSGVEDGRTVVAAKLPRSDPRAGIFGYDEVVRREQITDGAANTILLIGTGNLAGPWAAGGGATIRGAREPYFGRISGFGSRGTPRPGAYTVFADGAVRFIAADVDPSVFRSMATVHGGERLEASSLPERMDSLPTLKLQDLPPLKLEVEIAPGRR